MLNKDYLDKIQEKIDEIISPIDLVAEAKAFGGSSNPQIAAAQVMNTIGVKILDKGVASTKFKGETVVIPTPRDLFTFVKENDIKVISEGDSNMVFDYHGVHMTFDQETLFKKPFLSITTMIATIVLKIIPRYDELAEYLIILRKNGRLVNPNNN